MNLNGIQQVGSDTVHTQEILLIVVILCYIQSCETGGVPCLKIQLYSNSKSNVYSSTSVLLSLCCLSQNRSFTNANFSLIREFTYSSPGILNLKAQGCFRALPGVRGVRGVFGVVGSEFISNIIRCSMYARL